MYDHGKTNGRREQCVGRFMEHSGIERNRTAPPNDAPRRLGWCSHIYRGEARGSRPDLHECIEHYRKYQIENAVMVEYPCEARSTLLDRYPVDSPLEARRADRLDEEKSTSTVRLSTR